MSRASTPIGWKAQPGAPYRLPERIGPFTVRAQVGWGGTACTFIGSRPGPRGAQRLKCLKIPSPFLLTQLPPDEVRRIFQNEVDAVRLLPPGNIAHLEDVVELGDAQGVMCLVYAFIDGMNLGQLIATMRAEGRLLKWEAVVGIARDIAKALAETHADRRHESTPYNHPPVVHRDIAPANAMIDVRGSTFLIDFGFARAMEVSRLQASRAHPGRIAYSAPEYLCELGTGAYDPRLDLFSLGALLFEALTGQRPFRGISVEDHLRQVRTRDRKRIESLRPEFHAASEPPPDLVKFAHIVYCLLEPEPDDRFQSADALLSALGALRVGHDQRPLGRAVRSHQSPLQQRVTESRVDRRADESCIVATQDAFEEPSSARASIPPEDILIDPLAASDLARLAAAPDERDAARDRPLPHAALARLDDATERDRPVSQLTLGGVHQVTERDELVQELARRLSDYEASLDAPSPRATGISGVHATASREPQEPSIPAQAIALPSAIPTDEESSSKRPFAIRHINLPAYPDRPREDGPRTDPRTPRMRVAAFALGVLFAFSLFLLGTMNTLWVPLVTGQLGWTIVDGFWTPLLTRVGLLGVTVACLGGLTLATLWVRGRSRGSRSDE